MRNINKLISIILCLAMVMGLAVVAGAESAATISFADASARVSIDDEQQVWEANGIKLTNDRNGAKSKIADYVNPVRLYKGTSLTIEYTGMTKLVAICPTEDYAKVWVNTNTDSNATVTYAADGSNFAVTVIFAAATDSFVLESLSAQTRIRELSVYTGSTGEPDTPVIPEPPVEEEKEIVDISVALAAESGEFTVKGVVTCVDSSNIYVQDATGSICVRMAEKPTDIALGDTIIGTGSKTVYNGLPQLGSGTYEKSEGCTLVAKETTIGSLTTADICGYVQLSDLTVTEVFDNDGAYATPNITVSDGTNEIEIYKATVEKVDGEWPIKVGDVIDVKAAVSCYKETLRLRTTVTSEITVKNGQPTPDPDPEPDPDPVIEIVDISVVLAAESGTFKVKGVVTCVDSSNIYVQDATGAICVRMAEKPTDIALGDTIIGTGTRNVYNGMTQLLDSTYEKSEGCALVAKDTTIAALTTSDVCGYVKLSGLTIVEIYDNNGAYSSPNITVTDGTNQIQIYKAVISKNDDGTWALAVGDVIDVKAAVGCFKETLQLRNTLASEITKVEQDASYTVSGTVVSAGDGEALVELLLNGEVIATANCVDGAYSFADVSSGTYTLRFSKVNHVAVEIELTVVDADVVADGKICLAGDLNGDGKVNMKDWSVIYNHVSETSVLTGYALECADVTGDGKVNMKDWSRLYGHLSEENPLW